MPDMPHPDDDTALQLCDVCRHLFCICAQTVAEIDAWCDAYLGSEQCAQDFFQARGTAQRFLANLCKGRLGPTRSPAYLEDMELDE